MNEKNHYLSLYKAQHTQLHKIDLIPFLILKETALGKTNIVAASNQ